MDVSSFTPTNIFLYPINFGKDCFNPFKNGFQVFFFWNIFGTYFMNSEFFIQKQKNMFQNRYSEIILSSEFSIPKTPFTNKTSIPETFFLIESLLQIIKTIKNNFNILKNIWVQEEECRDVRKKI